MRFKRSEADLTGGMGQDTEKNERTVISLTLSPLNKRDNCAKQHAGVPRHERYRQPPQSQSHNLFCQALISVLSPFFRY